MDVPVEKMGDGHMMLNSPDLIPSPSAVTTSRALACVRSAFVDHAPIDKGTLAPTRNRTYSLVL